jgi:hypothetical protein
MRPPASDAHRLQGGIDCEGGVFAAEKGGEQVLHSHFSLLRSSSVGNGLYGHD